IDVSVRRRSIRLDHGHSTCGYSDIGCCFLEGQREFEVERYRGFKVNGLFSSLKTRCFGPDLIRIERKVDELESARCVGLSCLTIAGDWLCDGDAGIGHECAGRILHHTLNAADSCLAEECWPKYEQNTANHCSFK